MAALAEFDRAAIDEGDDDAGLSPADRAQFYGPSVRL
jgi:hypothetical protein